MTTVAYPTAPAVTKPRGTLLDAATVDPSGFAWHDGVGLWDSYNGMDFDAEANFCVPSSLTLTALSTWTDGFRFAAYGGVTCKAIGLDQSNMEAEASRAFEAGESTAVEKALVKYRFVANAAGAGIPGAWPAPTDITPAGGAVKPAVAVALLEEKAGELYVGMPTIHAPRSVANLVTYLDGAEFEGDTLRTKLGSKIAAGAGYQNATSPTGTAAAAGEKWVYATGEVYVAPGPLGTVKTMNTTTNDVVVLIERGYIVAVDTFAVAIRVNPSA